MPCGAHDDLLLAARRFSRPRPIAAWLFWRHHTGATRLTANTRASDSKDRGHRVFALDMNPGLDRYRSPMDCGTRSPEGMPK